MKSFSEIFSIADHLSEDDRQKIISSIKEIEVKKGTVLQRAGESGSKAYYVKSGLLRSYVFDEKGKEHVFMFGPEGWVVGDFELNLGAPALLSVDVIEDSVIEVVDQSQMDEFTKLIPPKHFPREIIRLMNRVRVLQKRIILLMGASTIERYEDFIKTYPDIVQRVPQKMIASYLGVTPEALSKVKSEFLKRN